jgi:hypothetical protein
MSIIIRIRYSLPVFVISIGILIFELTNTDGIYFGSLINRIHPCVQDPLNSAPCYIGYDVIFMIALGIIALVTFLLILSEVFKQLRKRD